LAYKKIVYNGGEGIAKIKFLDESGKVLENWTIMWSDLGKWVKQMESKYSINLKNKKMDSDLDWLR
jgi:hypothetical protein